jgi:hypothetical protein
MHVNVLQKVCAIFLFFLIVFWMLLFLTGSREGFYNYLYGFLFGLIPLLGGALAMYRARIWGNLKSAVGKGMICIGAGLFLWGTGEMIWSFYNFVLNVPAPYPSLADIGFAPSIFFYGLGAYYISRTSGITYSLRRPGAKIFIIIAPIVVFVVSYYILVIVARGGVLVSNNSTWVKTVFDIVYPLGDFIGLLIAVLVSGLSLAYMGGRYMSDMIAIFAGLAVMFIADSVFSYTTTVGTYYNGSYDDLLLTLGMFLMTYGILGYTKIKSDSY